MTAGLYQRDFVLDPADNARLSNLCGPFDEHLRQVELRLGVEINHRGNIFQVIGEEGAARATEKVMTALYASTESEALTGAKIHLHLAESGIEAITADAAESAQEVTIKVKRGVIKGRGPNQARYLHAITSHDISFGVGPAAPAKPIWPLPVRWRHWKLIACNAFCWFAQPSKRVKNSVSYPVIYRKK